MSDKITNLRELKEEIAKNIAQNIGWVYSKLLEFEATLRNFDDEELQHLEKRELLRRVLGDK